MSGGSETRRPYSRFATADEATSPEFMRINGALNDLHVRYGLADHSDLNAERYPWSAGLLGRPAFYAARLWEFPFALEAAALKPGMRVADLGCGMTPFTIYLRECERCEVIGVDPDFPGANQEHRGHGVTKEFQERTGLAVVQGGMEAIPLETASQDRVFCISVIEHLPMGLALRGLQEIARILKPGGRAVVTVDVSMSFHLTRPLDLIWASGLNPLGEMDLRWPKRRFGMFSETFLPADVFGMTLAKEDYWVDTRYAGPGQDGAPVEGYRVPSLIPHPQPPLPPILKQLGHHFLKRNPRVLRLLRRK